MKNACRMSILMLLLSLVATGIVFAQSDLGTISGFIKDQSGASVPNAKVTIKNQTGIERQTMTNDSGYYSITNIPPGFYTMSAEAPGFQKYESTHNQLDPSGHLGLDATLTLGAATQTVERSEEHTSELQSRLHLVCRLLLEKKKKKTTISV